MGLFMRCRSGVVLMPVWPPALPPADRSDTTPNRLRDHRGHVDCNHVDCNQTTVTETASHRNGSP